MVNKGKVEKYGWRQGGADRQRWRIRDVDKVD